MFDHVLRAEHAAEEHRWFAASANGCSHRDNHDINEIIGGRSRARWDLRRTFHFWAVAKLDRRRSLGEKQTEFTQEFVAFDFGEAQSLGELLLRTGFNKFVVLENFHYLPVETQQQIAFDLKTFHEIAFALSSWEFRTKLTC